MAVVRQPQSSRLVIKVEAGMSTSGKPLHRMRSFKNIKTDATDADVFAVGQALAELQKHPVEAVDRIDDGKLVSE